MKKKLTKAQESALLNKYFKNKEELDQIRSDVTLLRWKVLSNAYKQGKEIWGNSFTVFRLAKDMEMPYTTVKRCLSLDRATETSWKMVKQKKISVFRLAMVCQLKANGFQDEIVKEVIDKNLSTYQIKSFKPKNIDDIRKWKHKKAVEKGYSRQDSAYRALCNWIARGNMFLIMPISSVGKAKEKEMLSSLKKLHDKLGRYLKKNGVQ